MDLQLTGKRALVTGGSRGIGKEIARVLLEEGVRVVIAARDPERLAATADELAAAIGGEIHTLAYEAGDDESARSMVEAAAAALGGLDILVNNAAQPGGTAPPNLAAVTTSDFATDMNVKVMGYLRCAQAAAPIMAAAGWGRIVNIGGTTAYTTANMLSSMRVIAAASLTKNLADQLGESGINVNLVHPGATRTEKTSDEQAARSTSNVIGRIIESAEVADVVAFLCSPKAAAVTGEMVSAGGESAALSATEVPALGAGSVLRDRAERSGDLEEQDRNRSADRVLCPKPVVLPPRIASGAVARTSRVALVVIAVTLSASATSPAGGAATLTHSATATNAQLLATEQHDVGVAEAQLTVALPAVEGAPAPVAPTELFKSPLPAHQVLGFIGGAGFSGVTSTEFADISTLVTNAVEIGANGTILDSGPGWNDLNDPSFASFVATAHAADDRVLLDVSSESLPTIAHFLRVPTASAAALAGQLGPILKADHIDGIDLDVEGRVPAESSHFLTYVTVLARDLKAAVPSSEIICNTFPQSASDGADFFDVAALARRVDALFVMSYDMVTNGLASANAPLASPTLGLSDVQAVLAYIKVVAPAKLILGIPFYGYDFTTISKTPGAASVGDAESVSVGDVVAVGRPALWDVGSETPFSVFQRGSAWHQTWFEDPVSVALKTALATELHLGGVGVWSLGQEGDETALLGALDGGAAPTR